MIVLKMSGETVMIIFRDVRGTVMIVLKISEELS